MKASLKVYLAQINTVVGDLHGNRERVLRAIGDAKRKGADLVTFPELALTGYPPEDLLLQRHFISGNLKALKSIAHFTRGIYAVVGFVDRDKRRRLFNAAALLSDGKIQNVYHKVSLPNYGVFDERRYFVPGDRPGVWSMGKLKVGISICEDIWQKDNFVYQKKVADKISLLINISASPYHLGKQSVRERLLKSLARHIEGPVIYNNLVGGQDELVFDGGSLIVDARGRFMGQARRFEEDARMVEIPMRRGAGPRGPTRPAPLRLEEEVYKALLLGTRDYIKKNGFKKVLIGLSGGIDSALVARIAVDALGPRDVIGVTLPSMFSSKETYRDAKQLAKNLGIPCLEFNIDGVFKKYLGLFKKTFAPYPKDITEENLQARIRGNILMALSNKFGYLVLTTGNKSEMATGYCTLYGDMAGGFAVIKDVPKTLVFRLARYRNCLPPKNSIPFSILKRPPTAELKANQEDQDTLPPYTTLDKFLELYVEKDMSLEEIVRKGVPLALARKMAGRVDRSEYKRRQSPPGVKITLKAFGRDRRIPITNRYEP